jgi:hypothetical protein
VKLFVHLHLNNFSIWLWTIKKQTYLGHLTLFCTRHVRFIAKTNSSKFPVRSRYGFMSAFTCDVFSPVDRGRRTDPPPNNSTECLKDSYFQDKFWIGKGQRAKAVTVEEQEDIQNIQIHWRILSTRSVFISSIWQPWQLIQIAKFLVLQYPPFRIYSSPTFPFISIISNDDDSHGQVTSRLNAGNACYHSVHNFVSSPVLSKHVKIKI